MELLVGILTRCLLAFLLASTFVWVAALLHERGVNPLRRLMAARTFSLMPKAVTSLRFARLDQMDCMAPDRDGDGIPTADELFIHRTDPGSADTDMDGLSDRDELNVWRTDPLDPHSLSPDFCDGMAARLGGENPWANPEGSTNTVWEHVFYTGTTNGAFAYPESTGGCAVLEVSVSGSGSVPNVSDLVVNGRLDLVNLFPVKLDLKPFIDAWGSAATFRISAPDGSLHFCGVNVSPNAVNTLQTEDVAAKGASPSPLHSAALTSVTNGGVPVAASDFLGEGNEPGVLAFEAVETYGRPTLAVFVGEDRVLQFELPISLSSVRDMYRWLNIRYACGDHGGAPSSLVSPWNCPDNECDGRHFVFVHGYNVNPTQARAWADAMFKRLWWSGSKSRFTAVDWRGDESQFSTLMHGDVSPDYYANVRNAFMSASALEQSWSSLPGTKALLAHSLGNMLVSSAIKDCAMTGYAKYYMLNAAVPMEAYDVLSDAAEMVDSAWSNVPVNCRASDWSALFATDDIRASLSWRGRFAGIQNAINCYSETEDVLANPTLHGLGGSWAKQELFKGTVAWNALNALSFGNLDVACEGGWGINTYYALNPTVYVPGYGFMSNAVAGLTRDDVIAHPLFTPFRVEANNMHSTNLFTIADETYGENLRAKFLGDAIPATSFASGRNSIGNNAALENYNYQGRLLPNGWPRNQAKWIHSDIKDVAYFYIYDFFDKLTGRSNQ